MMPGDLRTPMYRMAQQTPRQQCLLPLFCMPFFIWRDQGLSRMQRLLRHYITELALQPPPPFTFPVTVLMCLMPCCLVLTLYVMLFSLLLYKAAACSSAINRLVSMAARSDMLRPHS